MTTADTTHRPTKQTGRHQINIGHLVMGIAFAGIVVVWILIKSDAVTGDDVRWLLPVPWVLAGVAGLLATTRRKQPEPEYDVPHRGWVGPDESRAAAEDTHLLRPAYDDLDEKLARAERETHTRSSLVTPAAPAAPADSADSADPADPADPSDTQENPR
jgi:hypothetical protein